VEVMNQEVAAVRSVVFVEGRFEDLEMTCRQIVVVAFADDDGKGMLTIESR
jgi:hypothetical protein